MKKTLLILFIGIFLFSTISIVYADSSNDYISIDTFSVTLEQKGYNISNDNDIIYAIKGNITFQYIYFDDENKAKVELEEICQIIDSNEYS